MNFTVSAISDFGEDELRRIYSILSPAQQEYINAKPRDKALQSLAARALLARIIGEQAISSLQRDRDGRPQLKDRHVSLSHSDNFVAVAVGDRPVGIDIQLKRFVCEKTAVRVCCREETDFLQSSPDGFFTLWTLKEAYIKATSTGFSKAVNTCFIKDGVPCSPEGKSIHTRQGDLFISVIEL